MKALTHRQEAVLDFIKREDAAYGRLPTAQRIAQYMGWKNDSSARECLQRLAQKGHLESTRVPARNKPGFRYLYELKVPLFDRSHIEKRFNEVV